jgi:competence protein ComGA
MNEYFNQLILLAIQEKALDIYLLPTINGYEVKFHNGSLLNRVREISSELSTKLISYVKFIANMNISELRRPQLGSFDFQYEQNNLPLRVSTVSQFDNQETMVIRIIYDQNNHQLNWLDPMQYQKLKMEIPESGLMLIVGPTGSGKTSTIHSIIDPISKKELVLTIEDPVEIKNPNIVQLQVNEKADMSYSELIKVSLRHHPNVLVVGEIRDEKTAKATLQAALSGHLVLATIHAGSAKMAVERMLELGIEKNLLKNTLKVSVYQRLVKDLNGKLSAILDIQNKVDLHNNSFNFTKNWNETLINAKNHKKINQEVYNKFIKIAS